MLLALDIGNTDVTLGWFRAGVLLGTARIPTIPTATPVAFAVRLDAALAGGGVAIDDVGSLVLASVVPALTLQVEALAVSRDRALLVAGAANVPVPVRVERPAEVGADRLVNALAAARLYGTPAVVADLGTATTIDAIAPDGAFLGGAIAPGIRLGLDTLVTRTAQLPAIELRAPDRAIGRNTVAAMQSGVVIGYQVLTGGLIDRVRRELATEAGVAPEAVRTIVTGGFSNAAWIVGIDGVDAVDPDLTLKGLAILHAEVADGEPLAVGTR